MIFTVCALLALGFQGQAGPPDILTTAFKDSTARRTLLHARAARRTQDSTLTSYDAMGYERMSVGMSIGRLGRDHLLFRQEEAARVRWQRGVGAWMDVRGKRAAIPMATSKHGVGVQVDVEGDGVTLPYYPGYEPLWMGSSRLQSQVDETQLVHPLAEGAEAYYTYRTGDSISIRLPDGHSIQLRELIVRPREPKWNLAVGSLWFDTGSGQLVRAVYRLAIPIDIWNVAREKDPKKKGMDDVPFWVKPVISPMRAEVSSIAVEYGLHEGRFWLPKLRAAEGSATVGFMRLPFSFEQSYTYASVNGTDSLPPIQIAAGAGQPDSSRRSRTTLAQRASSCDTSSTHSWLTTRRRNGVPVVVSTPCDTMVLARSKDLPPSMYDAGDEIFGEKELAELRSEALSMSAQAPFSMNLHTLPPPTVTTGLSMMRYNRVEGLSLGASIEQELGGGYDVSALGRIGVADREPNVELTALRTDLVDAVHLSLYNHLVSANDWGHPLSFGSSVAALLFGRDEGFYYRASGAEVGGARDAIFSGTRLTWRAFAEEQRTASVHSNFALDGADLPPNLTATRGWYEGLGARITRDYGLDPQGLRVSTDLRVEAGVSDSAYGRGALDLTVQHPIASALAASLTLSGGGSIGALPPQRMWYLGGSQTIRGQSPDTTQRGNAFWMTRLEVGDDDTGMRPTVFGDLGWVGDRARLRDVGRPMSGVGAGVSFLDGLMRFDVARGIYPRKQWRVDFYLESRF